MTTDRDEILALYEGQARDEVEDLLSKVGVIQQSHLHLQQVRDEAIRYDISPRASATITPSGRTRITGRRRGMDRSSLPQASYGAATRTAATTSTTSRA